MILPDDFAAAINICGTVRTVMPVKSIIRSVRIP
jgi:hypothetical protein